jgi:hypothetical protein
MALQTRKPAAEREPDVLEAVPEELGPGAIPEARGVELLGSGLRRPKPGSPVKPALENLGKAGTEGVDRGHGRPRCGLGWLLKGLSD